MNKIMIQTILSCLKKGNNDDKCFLYSILAFLYPINTNRENVNQYIQFSNKLDISMLNFPQKINNDIQSFEKVINLIINMYTVVNVTIVPVRL